MICHKNARQYQDCKQYPHYKRKNPRQECYQIGKHRFPYSPQPPENFCKYFSHGKNVSVKSIALQVIIMQEILCLHRAKHALESDN